MRVCCVFPACNPDRARTALERWHAQGYEVGVWVEALDVPGADLVVRARSYPGYWRAVDLLARRALAAGADVVVAAGDDMDPDSAKRAGELAAEYLARFPGGLGIMQPTGDPMDGTTRICGSPWMGRAWIERAYGGAGPLWPEYGHYFADEELLHVAKRLGLLWQRPDVTQFHHHWCRPGGAPKQPYQEAASKRWYRQDRQTFARRKQTAFPCSDPLEVMS